MVKKGSFFGKIVISVIVFFAVFLAVGCKAKAQDEITSPTGIQLVRIPAGTFTMGSPNTEAGRDDDETQHQVTVSSFYMGKYEVTQGQWQAVMGSLPSDLTDDNYGKGDNNPIYHVSWYDAIVFCNKLSIKEGLTPAYSIGGKTNPDEWGTVPTSGDKTWIAVVIVSGSNGYRLPTEAQWEYAARGGQSGNSYKTYSGSDTIDDVAWYSGNNGSSGTDTYGTKQVGTKAANELGIYDMSGNVWEWCWDWYGTYLAEAQTDPVDKHSESYVWGRVFRGGSWYFSAQIARSASRGVNWPYYRIGDVGFRLLRP